VQDLLSSLPEEETPSEVGVEEATFKEVYSECFVAAFLADLNQVRDEGGNSTMVAYCLDSTAASFPHAQWKHF
jgi:glycosylphosphatidylinositol transamidase (GPIT) subunit GPI8